MTLSEKVHRFPGKYLLSSSLNKYPAEQQKQQLKSRGVELLDYIPNNAYTAVITAIPDETILRQLKQGRCSNCRQCKKCSLNWQRVIFRPVPLKWQALPMYGSVFPRTFTFEEVSNELLNNGILIYFHLTLKRYRIIALRVAVQRLGELALLPCIEYVQAVPGEDVPLSFLWPNWGKDANAGLLVKCTPKSREEKT